MSRLAAVIAAVALAALAGAEPPKGWNPMDFKKPTDDEQKRLAEASKSTLQKRFDQPIVTEIVPAGEFWPAEEYHQRYHEKNPIRYKYYRWNCGRDARLTEVWGADAPPAMAKP